MPKEYLAIIGDIRSSKDLPDRYLVQKKLKSVLDSVNEKYSESIAAKFVITLGDEFQGLMCDPSSVMDILEEINISLEPAEIRYGFGIGEMRTEINPDMALGADGPAFYCAREAITDVKKMENRSKSERTNIKIKIENKDEEKTHMANSLLSLMYVQSKKWTKGQRKIIHVYQRSGKHQADCAKTLNISQSVVSRQLKAANYFSYQKASQSIANFLTEEVNIKCDE